MNGFLLEVVNSGVVRKGSRTYWTEQSARSEANRLVRIGKAVRVRVLRVSVSDRAFADIPENREVSRG